jgi:hypothetical protein
VEAWQGYPTSNLQRPRSSIEALDAAMSTDMYVTPITISTHRIKAVKWRRYQLKL